MNEILLIYPYDPKGTSLFNFIKGEEHKLTSSQGKDYAFLNPLKSPFLEKDLTITDVRTGRVLQPNDDYRFQLPFVNDVSDIKCYRIIEILNTDYHDSILSLDYRTLGSDMVFDEIEIMEWLATIEVNPRSINWSDIVEKPGRYKAEEHLHHIKDFYGMNTMIDLLNNAIAVKQAKHDALVKIIEDHIEEPNAHNIELIDLGLHRLKNLYPATVGLFDKTEFTIQQRLAYLTPSVFREWLDANYLRGKDIIKVHLDGPSRVTQASTSQWRISNYDSFSDYDIRSAIGTFTRTEDIIYGEFYITDDIGPQKFTVVKDGFSTEFNIEIVEAGIVRPTIEGIANNERNVPLSARFSSAAMATSPVNKDVIKMCLYQIATEPTFNEIVHLSSSTVPSEIELARLDKLTRYYLRVKQYGTIYESEWSETVEFVTEDIDVPAVVFSPESTIYSGSRYGHDFVAGVSIRSEYYNDRILSAVEYKLTEVVANSTQRPIVAVSGIKLLDYTEDKPSDGMRWCPLQSSDNAELGPYGEGGYNSQSKHFKENTFHELTVRIRLGDDDWSDWSAPKAFKTSSVSSRVVQESETVGEGDSAYTSYYDKEIQTYS